MNKQRRPLSLEEGKIQASKLLKAVRFADPAQINRFKQLPEFADLSLDEILLQEIKRKHALAVIAIENGFNSWVELKMQVHFIVGGYLNLWFPNYKEAKTQLESAGGFLLPYKKQFFICNAEYLKQIGFNPDDPDWNAIAYDWAEPADLAAWQRLYKKWKLNPKVAQC